MNDSIETPILDFPVDTAIDQALEEAVGYLDALHRYRYWTYSALAGEMDVGPDTLRRLHEGVGGATVRTVRKILQHKANRLRRQAPRAGSVGVEELNR